MIDSDIREMHGPGQDTQAISGFSGAGPFKIASNELEGVAESVMFGGAPPAIPGLVPSGIEIRGSHFDKPPFRRDGVLPMPQDVTAQGAPGGSLTAGATLYYRVAAPATPSKPKPPSRWGPGRGRCRRDGPGWVGVLAA